MQTFGVKSTDAFTEVRVAYELCDNWILRFTSQTQFHLGLRISCENLEHGEFAAAISPTLLNAYHPLSDLA